VLAANVEQRLAELKSSTHINGIQHLFLLPLFSEANASGMVSSFPIPFMRLAMLHFSWSRERMVFRFGAWRVFPFLVSRPFAGMDFIGI
jgi:hypothetical protein